MNSGFLFKNGVQPASELAGLNFGSTGKGASVGATVGSVVPGVGTAIGAGAGAVVGTVASLFGGGKKYSDCGSKQQQVAQTFSKYFSSSDIQQLIADHRQNVGDFSGSTAYDLAFHYLGGSNCQVDTSEGKAWDGRVNQLLQQRQQQQQQAQQSAAQNSNTGATGKAKAAVSAVPSWVLPVGIGVGALGLITAIAS